MANLTDIKSALHKSMDDVKIESPENYVDSLVKNEYDADTLLIKCLYLSDEKICEYQRALDVINSSRYLNTDLRFIILKFYIEYYRFGMIDSATKKQLDGSEGKEDSKYSKLIPHLIYLYNVTIGDSQAQYESLMKSTICSPDSVYNFSNLSQHNYNRGEYRNALINIRKALSNIRSVFEPGMQYNEFTELDFDAVISEHITGIRLSYVNFDSLVEFSEKVSKRMEEVNHQKRGPL